MSEHFPGHEQAPEPFEHLALPDAAHAEKLRPGEADPTKNKSETLQEVRKAVAETAQSGAQLQAEKQLAGAEKAPREHHRTRINRQLKDITLKRELSSIRHKLSAPDRTLSKVIHQPAVRAVSEVAGKTLSRPSGLLGGGLVAFSGTTAYLLMAKHYGFEYNSFVFLALFMSGFVVGIGLELAVHLATAKRHNS